MVEKAGPTERRKNPARIRTGGVTYLVTLDADGKRWTITCDDKATGGFARDKATEIGLAYREASAELASSGAKISVWSVQNGKRRSGLIADNLAEVPKAKWIVVLRRVLRTRRRRRKLLFKEQRGKCRWCLEPMSLGDSKDPDYATFEHMTPAWCRYDAAIERQKPINSALVPPPKRPRNRGNALFALPALPKLGLLPGRKPDPRYLFHASTSSSGQIRRCCAHPLNLPRKADIRSGAQFRSCDTRDGKPRLILPAAVQCPCRP